MLNDSMNTMNAYNRFTNETNWHLAFPEMNSGSASWPPPHITIEKFKPEIDQSIFQFDARVALEVILYIVAKVKDLKWIQRKHYYNRELNP